jgi:branched-subunit amino acid ABC-type transport system permease component
VALGYTLVYGIIELINFAHGEIFMIGAFTSFAFWTEIGLTPSTGTAGLVGGLVLTLVVAMLVSSSLNVMIERVGYRPLRSAPKLAPLITAVGFSFILQNVGVLWLGASQRGVPDLIESEKTGLFCDPEQPETFCAEVEKLLANPDLAAQLATTAKAAALRRFHPQTIARKHVEIYRQALAA